MQISRVHRIVGLGAREIQKRKSQPSYLQRPTMIREIHSKFCVIPTLGKNCNRHSPRHTFAKELHLNGMYFEIQRNRLWNARGFALRG